MTDKQRTPQQRKSLEVWCAKMADALNAAGFDQRKVLELFARPEMPNTQESIKDVFRGCGAIVYPETMGEKPSTTKLDTVQIQEVFEAVSRQFSTTTGIFIEWPSEDSLRNQALERRAA